MLICWFAVLVSVALAAATAAEVFGSVVLEIVLVVCFASVLVAVFGLMFLSCFRSP